MNPVARLISRVLVILVLLAALAACGVPAPAPTPTPPPTATPTRTPAPPTAPPTPAVTPTPDLSGLPPGVWQLARIEYPSGKVLTIEQPQNYTVQFLGEGRIAIKADCNAGSGTFQTNEQRVTIGALVTTKMACGPGSQDMVFLNSLSNAAAYLLDGEEFTISLAYDGGEMVFRRAK